MENNIKTFENFNKNTTVVNSRDLVNSKGDSDWNPRKLVNRSNGSLTYVMGDQRIRDIEDELDTLQQEIRIIGTNKKDITDLITKKVELKAKIAELRKDKVNSIQRWIYKESPSSSDKVLYMTPEQAKEVNDCFKSYQQEKKKYNEYINKYNQVNINSGYHRSKKEL